MEDIIVDSNEAKVDAIQKMKVELGRTPTQHEKIEAGTTDNLIKGLYKSIKDLERKLGVLENKVKILENK